MHQLASEKTTSHLYGSSLSPETESTQLLDVGSLYIFLDYLIAACGVVFSLWFFFQRSVIMAQD